MRNEWLKFRTRTLGEVLNVYVGRRQIEHLIFETGALGYLESDAWNVSNYKFEVSNVAAYFRNEHGRNLRPITETLTSVVPSSASRVKNQLRRQRRATRTLNITGNRRTPSSVLRPADNQPRHLDVRAAKPEGQADFRREEFFPGRGTGAPGVKTRISTLWPGQPIKTFGPNQPRIAKRAKQGARPSPRRAISPAERSAAGSSLRGFA